MGVAVGIVLILTICYFAVTLAHNKDILRIFIKTSMFFCVALLIVSALATMFVGGHLGFGLLMILLIVFFCASFFG